MARKQQMLNDSSKTIGGAALLVVLLDRFRRAFERVFQ